MRQVSRIGFSLTFLLVACGGPDVNLGGSAPDLDTFLTEYQQEFQELDYKASLAEWALNTHIVEGDTTNAARSRRAQEALAKFVGSVDNIERIRGFLAHPGKLTDLQRRQLEAMLYRAAQSPQTVPQVVEERIAAETEQVEKLFGYDFQLEGHSVTTNEIDQILRESTDLDERLRAWQASKEVGKVLRPGLIRLRDLRNETVGALGYPDFFTYQVSDYGMTTEEMGRLTDLLMEQLRPLYREIHTWARYELAQRYGAPVPELLPAHWLPNRWGQDWTALVNVEGLNVDSALAGHDGEWVVRQAEDFYVSLGFPHLPNSFWERSSLYPVPADAPYKKNNHASAWHLDLDHDIRSLMSVEPNAYWYGTAHHELGHIYYYISYSRPEIPLILRSGANRAYHEGLGSMIGLAAQQRRFLVSRGLAPADARVDRMRQMLREALDFVVFIPWSAGVMTRYEKALYADDLPAEKLNSYWWKLKRHYQGIAPPSPRGEEYTDAASKTHITDDAAQYYDYALSYALLFQLHVHIADEILGQDPHDTDYFGNPQVGDFLRTIMEPGATRPWRDVLKETTGRELDAQAMVEYFQPLLEWLRQQNRGRKSTLPGL